MLLKGLMSPKTYIGQCENLLELIAPESSEQIVFF